MIKTKISYYWILGLVFSSCILLAQSNTEIVELRALACSKEATDTIEYKIGNHSIKLPSIFEHSAEETFGPIADDPNMHFTAFSIYTPETWQDSRIMYSKRLIVAGENLTWEGYWDGNSKYTDQNYARQHEGAFRYTFRAKINGIVQKYEGWACLIRKEQ